MGLRWEYFGPISEKNGHLASRSGLVPGATTCLPAQGFEWAENLYEAQKGKLRPSARVFVEPDIAFSDAILRTKWSSAAVSVWHINEFGRSDLSERAK